MASDPPEKRPEASSALAVVGASPSLSSLHLPTDATRAGPFDDALAHVLSRETRRVYLQVYLAFSAFLLKLVEASAPEGDEQLLRRAAPLLPQVTATVVCAYRDGMRGASRAPATVNVHLSALSTMFSLLVAKGVIARNPAGADVVRRLRVSTVSKTATLNAAEVRHFLAVTRRDSSLVGCRDLALLSTFIWTGLRRAEVCALALEDSRIEHGVTVYYVPVKGGGSRAVEIVPVANEAIEAWLARAGIEHGRVFPITVDSVHNAVYRRCADAGFPGVTPHGLRHAHITLALQGGAKLEDVQLWVGHADPRTTARYYHARSMIGRSPARLINLDQKE